MITITTNTLITLIFLTSLSIIVTAVFSFLTAELLTRNTKILAKLYNLEQTINHNHHQLIHPSEHLSKDSSNDSN